MCVVLPYRRVATVLSALLPMLPHRALWPTDTGRMYGWLLLAYTLAIICVRVSQAGPFVLYESGWACNIAMAVTGWAFVNAASASAAAVTASLLAVAVDQFMWYASC
jgi:hypothetical protein